MPNIPDISHWPEQIRKRYENYLKTSFYFKDPALMASFQEALQEEGSLLKGSFPEEPRQFELGINARSFRVSASQTRMISSFPHWQTAPCTFTKSNRYA